MKAVILAGGMGTRISEETVMKPKPMVEIGGMPIIWHIMKTYAKYGVKEFIICCGYKGQMIKDFFLKYCVNSADLTFNLESKDIEYIRRDPVDWKVTLANTGLKTLTAGRVLKIRDYIGDDEEFMLTYGDGVSDIDINALLDFHHSHDTLGTITVTQPTGRFGTVAIEDDTGRILSFKEKSRGDSPWVNMGFMVFNSKVFDYLGDGSEMLESGPFVRLAADGQLSAYRHDGFWSPMDTVHDRQYLEGLWKSGNAPWKV